MLLIYPDAVSELPDEKPLWRMRWGPANAKGHHTGFWVTYAWRGRCLADVYARVGERSLLAVWAYCALLICLWIYGEK
jgi:hypothetical protein